MPHVPPDLRARLFADAEEIWDGHRARLGGRFSSFIPTDYEEAYAALVAQCEAGDTFVELGAGAGVVTILADMLGFDAYGIELDDWLVTQAIDLAERYHSDATFVAGSFVPAEVRDEVEHVPADFMSEVDGADAWDELGMTLGDFDVIYDYHWPEQADLHASLLERFGRSGAVVLRYSAEAGFEVSHL